jgi:hypothetical protein
MRHNVVPPNPILRSDGKTTLKERKWIATEFPPKLDLITYLMTYQGHKHRTSMPNSNDQLQDAEEAE